jgi:hypothetical protein
LAKEKTRVAFAVSGHVALPLNIADRVPSHCPNVWRPDDMGKQLLQHPLLSAFRDLLCTQLADPVEGFLLTGSGCLLVGQKERDDEWERVGFWRKVGQFVERKRGQPVDMSGFVGLDDVVEIEEQLGAGIVVLAGLDLGLSSAAYFPQRSIRDLPDSFP